MDCGSNRLHHFEFFEPRYGLGDGHHRVDDLLMKERLVGVASQKFT